MNIQILNSSSGLPAALKHLLWPPCRRPQVSRCLSAGYLAAALLAVGEFTTPNCYAVIGTGTLSLDTNDCPCPKCRFCPPGYNGVYVSSEDLCSTCTPDTPSVFGMPAWWVSEPFINLWIDDEPLGYQLPSGPEYRSISGTNSVKTKRAITPTYRT